MAKTCDRGVQSLACFHILHGVFNFVCYIFDMMICIISSAKPNVIILKVGRRNISVRGVQVIQDFPSVNIAISDVLVLQGTDQHFFNGYD